MSVVAVQAPVNQSILLNGGGTSDDNRIKIAMLQNSDTQSTAANVGATPWTIEGWINATSANTMPALAGGASYSDLVTGINAFLDNDRYRSQSGYNSYVLGLAGGVFNFGADSASGALVLQGGGDLRGVGGRHWAIQHNPTSGQMDLLVSGSRVATGTGPAVSLAMPTSPTYQNACGSGANASCSFSYPFLVFGAEKHDLNGGPSGLYPGAYGEITDIRISNIARYGATYTVPTARLTNDANTVALWDCTGSGSTLTATTGPDGTVNNLSRSTWSPY